MESLIINTGIGSGIFVVIGYLVTRWIRNELTKKDIQSIEHDAMKYALENIPNNAEFQRLYDKKYNELFNKYKIRINRKLLE